jgi:hypothetical protein
VSATSCTRNVLSLRLARHVHTLSRGSSEDKIYVICSLNTPCLACGHVSPDEGIAQGSSSLPSRTIYVGKNDEDLRLYVSRPGDSFRYAALSHCWGGSNPLTTTKANRVQHIRRIPHEKLPLTFRDAISVARSLGLAYLWIDSLCILQDSPEDWALQAGRMADIYEHSYVTISADAASDSSTGFLYRPARIIGLSASVPFDFSVDGKSYSGRLHVREKGLMLMRQMPMHGWYPGAVMEGQPLKSGFDAAQARACLAVPYEALVTKLSTRGWVLQERLLSRRTLHFGAYELGWECRKCIKCECTANAFRSRRGTPLLKLNFHKCDWPTLIREYTWMDLTVKEDRLPAISGLAAAIANRTY